MRSIGWFCRDLLGKEYGPYGLERVRGWLADGTLEADTEVRHSLDEDSQFAGDLEECPAENVVCLRHPKRAAVKYCLWCQASVCASCGGAPQAHYCRSCRNWYYNRRQIAGLVDYVLIPGGLLYAAYWMQRVSWEFHRNHSDLDIYFDLFPTLGVASFLTLAGYLLTKDSWSGRSPGKLLCGLWAVDVSTGLSRCKASQARERLFG